MVETIAQGMDVDVGECRDDDVVFVSEAIIVVEDESDEDECSLTSGTTICEEDSLSEATTATAGADGLVNGEWNSFQPLPLRAKPAVPEAVRPDAEEETPRGGDKVGGDNPEAVRMEIEEGKDDEGPTAVVERGQFMEVKQVAVQVRVASDPREAPLSKGHGAFDTSKCCANDQDMENGARLPLT